MFNVSPKSIKPSNKVMRISEHVPLQVFLYHTFLYVKFQISIRGGFQDCHKTSETKILQKQTTDDACFDH